MSDDTREMQTQGAIEKVNALTEGQRAQALKQARLHIAGAEPDPGREPKLDDFLAQGVGKYPPGVTRWIRRLSLLMLTAAFLPSAMRLHEVGRESFQASLHDVMSVYVAALCVVLMAEVGQVIFSLASAIVTTFWQRWGLRLGALICTLIALTGNAQAVNPTLEAGLFIWLETFAPPLLVLITAQVLKTQMLHAIEDLHHARTQFADAHAVWTADYEEKVRAWQDAFDNAHLSADWMRVVANALRDAIRKANGRSHRVMRELTNTEWYALIHRELAADQWYTRVDTQVRQREAEQRRVETPAPVRSQPVRSGATGGTHTGELDGTVREVAGAFVAACPQCEREFNNATERGAKNALVAHVRHAHPKAETQVEVSVNGRV